MSSRCENGVFGIPLYESLGEIKGDLSLIIKYRESNCSESTIL
jgi:hypothetical protein